MSRAVGVAIILGEMEEKEVLEALSRLPGAKPAKFGQKIAPMLATQVPRPFSDPDWVFEPKIDGFRGIVYVSDVVRILSRRGYDLTRSFSDLADSLKAIKHQTVLDGEITALASDGRPCFECLQQHIGMKSEVPQRRVPWPYLVTYFIFDILYLDGFDLTGVPLLERKKVLTRIIPKTGRFQLVDYFEDDGVLLFEKAVEQGFEGIVAKKKDSVYDPGKRSRNWLKAKASVVGRYMIGGYVVGPRTRSVGGLVVGQEENGRLEYKGTVAVSIGRQDKEALKTNLDRLAAEDSPFSENIVVEGEIVWTRPELRAEIRFTQWTHGGYMREPVFVKLVS